MEWKVSLVQFSRETGEREKNVERMKNHVRNISDTEIVCLPENWFGVKPIQESEFEKILSDFQEIASEKNITLLTGAGYIRYGEEILDSGFVIDNNGNVLGRADKLFPSEAVGETEFLEDGERSKVFEVNGSKIGVVVCVDAAYPEVSRRLASEGALLVFNPSNIPKNRIDMWRSIGITRAMENGIFYAFVNNTSTHYPDGRDVTGHSFIASPDGKILKEADESEQILQANIDLKKCDDLKDRWGFLERVMESDF